jgi:hypothetical protein
MSRNTSPQKKARSPVDLHAISPPAAILDSTPPLTELDAVASYWARLGVLFGVKPAHEQVDVELLICDTARVAPYDERLFVCAVSWVAQYHGFVNGRRLSAVAASLGSDASAVLGALLSVAGEAAGGAPELEAARVRCRPLAKPQPLFAAMRSMRVLSERVRRNALPIFAAWGLWHDDQTLKPAAIRPVTWLLERVPELRVRSLLGPSVEADLMARALADEVTVREVARATLTSYAAVHGAADRLVWRGLLVRERVAQSQVLRPTDFALDVLGGSELALGRTAARRGGARTRRSAARAIARSSKRAV